MDRREAKRLIKRTYKLADGDSNDAEIAGLQDARDLLEQWRRELKEIQQEAGAWADELEDVWEHGDLAAAVTNVITFLRDLATDQLADTWSSGSRQHYIETGRYLTTAEVREFNALQEKDLTITGVQLISNRDGVVTVTDLPIGDED